MDSFVSGIPIQHARSCMHAVEFVPGSFGSASCSSGSHPIILPGSSRAVPSLLWPVAYDTSPSQSQCETLRDLDCMHVGSLAAVSHRTKYFYRTGANWNPEAAGQTCKLFWTRPGRAAAATASTPAAPPACKKTNQQGTARRSRFFIFAWLLFSLCARFYQRQFCLDPTLHASGRQVRWQMPRAGLRCQNAFHLPSTLICFGIGTDPATVIVPGARLP